MNSLPRVPRDLLARLRPFAWYLPHLVALVLSAQESQRFILSSSFKLDGRRYYSLFDDAMISMRYAWQLVHGHGLVWNPGERIEGFTNPLWTLVMAACVAIFSKPNAVLAVQTIGAALIAVASVLYVRIAGKMLGRRPSLLVAVFEGAGIFALTRIFPLRFWSHMGMEVSLLVLIGAISWHIALRRPQRSQPVTWLGVLAAVGYTVRSDGFLVVIPPLLLVLAAEIPDRRTLPGKVLKAFAPLVLAMAAFSLLRYGYYGDWLPNTYRLKVGGTSLAFRLQNGWSFLEAYRAQIWPLAALGVVACAFRPRLRALALLAAPVSLYAYQVYVGGDPWPYWRQLTPGYPPLLLLVVHLVAAVSTLVRKRWRKLRTRRGPWHQPWGLHLVRASAPLVAAALILVAVAPTQAAFAKGDTLSYNVNWNRSNVARALVLEKILKKDGKMALFWAGSTGYYDTDHFAIDELGKCDRHVANIAPDLAGEGWSGMKSVPGHNKSDINYSVGTLDADYVETLDWSHDHATPELRAKFTRVTIGGHGFTLRKDSPRIDWAAVQALRKK